jgi:hypothetical protein
MPKRRRKADGNKPGQRGDYLKRRTFEQGKKQMDEAHYATHRLYCDVFDFWRGCKLRICQRHRRCIGEATLCLRHGLPAVPVARQRLAKNEAIAGGPRRLPPATHVERTVRESDLAQLLAWSFL